MNTHNTTEGANDANPEFDGETTEVNGESLQ